MAEYARRRAIPPYGGCLMRALQVLDSRKLAVVDLPEPPAPASGEVQIEIGAVALNHIDVWGWRGMAFAKRKLPIVVQSAGSDEDTELMLEHAHGHDWIAAAVVWLPLDSADQTAARLEALSIQSKVRGVRHQIHDEEDPHWILRPNVLESLRLVEERGLVLELPVVWPRWLAYHLRLGTLRQSRSG